MASERHHPGLPGITHVTDTSGQLISTASLTDKTVALYFSAHWCPPCQRFTPRLISFVQAHAGRLDVEVVFVSSDKDMLAYLAYYQTMIRFLAVPYDPSVTDALSRHYNVSGIPTLILLKPQPQEAMVVVGDPVPPLSQLVLTRSGVDAVSRDPAGEGFPWPEIHYVLEDLGLEAPLWRTDAFFGAFGDPYLDGFGGLSSSSYVTSKVFSILIRQLLDSIQASGGKAAASSQVSAAVLDAASAVGPLEKVLDLLATFESLSEPVLKTRSEYENPGQLLPVLQAWAAPIAALQPGDTLLVPGGWVEPRGVHCLAHMIIANADSSFDFVTFNTSVDEGLKYHPSSAAFPPKIKFRSALRLRSIPRERMLDPVWWAMLIKMQVAQIISNRAEVLYDVLLPWLAGSSLPSAMASSQVEDDPHGEWLAPQRAKLSHYGCLLEAIRYTLAYAGMPRPQLRTVLFALRVGFVNLLASDVGAVDLIHSSERALVSMATRQLAYAAVKEVRAGFAEPSFQASMLAALSSLDAALARVPAFGLPEGGLPPQLAMGTAAAYSPYPGFAFLKARGEDSYAGPAKPESPAPPFDFLDLPPRAVDFATALSMVQKVLALVETLMNHARAGHTSGPIPRHYEVIAVVNSLVLDMLPMPQAPASGITCIYTGGAVRPPQAAQLAFLAAIYELTAAFTSAWQSVKRPSRSADSERALVAGALLALFDAGARIKCAGKPLILSRLLTNAGGFHLSTEVGCETATLSYERLSSMAQLDNAPRLAAVRSDVLAYLDAIQTTTDRVLFNWPQEAGTRTLQVQKTSPTMDFVRLYITLKGFRLTDDPRETEMQALCRWTFFDLAKEEPLYGYARDMVVMFKFLATMESELADRKLRKRAVHKRHEMWQIMYESEWEAKRGSSLERLRFKVEGMNGDQTTAFVLMSGFGRPVVIYGDGLITQSPTDAEAYLGLPDPSEDDVLHCDNLPSFDDVLPDEDSEALMSYLTTQYLRIPLVVGFFATRDRLSYLFHAGLRDVLRGAVFELGSWCPPWLQLPLDSVPARRAVTNRDPLSCATGLLLNELTFSPGSVLDPLLDMMDAVADIPVNSETCRSRLLLWLAEAEAEDNMPTVNMCHAYLALIWRNVLPHELTPEIVSLLLGHLAFVRHWHEFGSSPKAASDTAELEPWERLKRVLRAHGIPTDRLSQSSLPGVRGSLERVLILQIGRDSVRIDLRPKDTETLPPPADVPEYELFTMLHEQRPALLAFLAAAEQDALDSVMSEVVRIALRGDDRASLRGWAPLEAADARRGMYAAGGGEVVVDVQTAEIQYKGNMLRALPASISEFDDYRSVFGDERYHCGLVSRQQHRLWLSLVGLATHVKEWTKPTNEDQGVGQPLPLDSASTPPDLSSGLVYAGVTYNRKFPTKLPSEAWVVALLNPVLQVHRNDDAVLLLPATLTPADATLVTLITWYVNEDTGDITYKLVRVLRHHQVVHVYDLISHGRKLYPSLVYSSNYVRALHSLPLPPPESAKIVPDAVRHQRGAIWKNAPLETSLVIERENAALGGREMYLPPRVLRGSLPGVLLTHYKFWQGDDDVIRGYPLDGDSSWFSQAIVVVLTPSADRARGAVPPCDLDSLASLPWMGTVVKLRKGMAHPRIPRLAQPEAALATAPRDGTGAPQAAAASSGAGTSDPSNAPHQGLDPELVASVVSSLGALGVAPPLAKYALSVIGSSGSGSFETLLARAVNWAMDNSDIEIPPAFFDDTESADDVDAVPPTPLARSDSTLEAFLRLSNDGAFPEPAIEYALELYSQDIDLAQAWLSDPANAELVDALGRGEDIAALSNSPSMDEAVQGALTLLNMVYFHSVLVRLADVLSRLEELSHVLVWTSSSAPASAATAAAAACVAASEEPSDVVATTLTDAVVLLSGATVTISLVELPRLGARFQPRLDAAGKVKLFALDQAGWWIADLDPAAEPLLDKLLVGIPHGVVLENASGELRVMVPNCDFSRPPIAPFSTELDLNRASSAWLARAPTRYYLYSVHTTRTFLHAPSVAATFYLILLRFAARDYEAVFRLSETCQVDVPFTSEEDRVFQLLGELGSDLTPDAVACRLKLSLCVLLGGNQLPWKLSDQYDKYLSRLSHVSAGCRLESEEEAELLPFIEAEEETPLLVGNRMTYLTGAADGATAVSLSSRVVKRGGDVWRLAQARQPVLYSMHHTTMSTVYYAMPANPVLDDTGVLSFMEALEQEEESGSTGKVGFLGLYDLLHPDSPASARLLGVDVTRSLGELQTRLYGVRGNAVTSVSFHNAQLAALINFPYVAWPSVPRVSPLPRMLVRGVEISCVDQELPQMASAAELLRNFFNELFVTLQSLVSAPFFDDAKARLAESAELEAVLAAPRETMHTISEIAVRAAGSLSSGAQAGSVFPRVANHGCDVRRLAPFTRSGLDVSAADLAAFATRPLSVLDLDAFVTFDEPQDAPTGALPFDLSPHPAAKSHVAGLILSRLDDDVTTFKAQVDASRVPRIVGLGSADVDELLSAADGAAGDAARDTALAALGKVAATLESLLCELRELAASDATFIADALAVVLAEAVAVPPGADGATEFELLRLHGARTELIFDHVTCTLLSDDAAVELRAVNPFLGDDGVATILELTQATLLHATRVAHVNRVVAAATQVQATLASLTKRVQTGAGADAAFASKVQYEVSNLGELLVCERHYGGVESGSGAFSYDPRFLVFEYIFDILLRQRQVEMVNDFVAASRSESHAMVQQMIMGAGKTTVIGPLLALILADGKQLVMQVVPTALLEMSRNVMRSRFTAIVPKRVYTFTYDRSEPDSAVSVGELWKKLDAARRRRAVVCTTPDAIKSLMLKYVEQLHSLETPHYLLTSGRAQSSELSTLDLLDVVVADGGVSDEVAALADADAADEGSAAAPGTLEALAEGRAYSELAARLGGVQRNERKLAQLMAKLHLRSDASDALVKIMNLWSEGVLMMDEVDVLLHPLKSELNYPIGEKYPIDMEGARWDLPIHLLDLVFSHKRGELFEAVEAETEKALGVSVASVQGALEAALDAGYTEHNLQRSPHLALMDVDYYHARLKPILAQWALFWVRERALGSLASVEHEALLAYMSGELEGPAAQDLAGEHGTLGQLLPVDMKLLNLAKDWLTSFLPHVLSKVDRVSYGILSPVDLARCDPRMPKSRRLTAVPFVGKDVPSRSSEFAQPDVVIGLTILADLRRVVEQLKKDFGQEIGPPAERPSSVLFSSWLAAAKERSAAADEMGVPLTPVSPSGSFAAAFGPGSEAAKTAEADPETGVFPLPLFQPNDPQQLDRLYRIIKRHPPFIHYYLRRQVFPPCMNFRKVKISASGQELGSNILFGTRLGFSGTPSNLMPADLGRCMYEAGSDGKILHVLTSPGVVSVEVKGDAWTAKSILRDVAAMEPPAHALIDTGALITGMDNEAVARYLLAYLPEWMEGVVYLDRNDKQMILLRSGGPGVPLSQCGVSLDKRFTFYDQVHTTGMDIKQTPNAQALLTIGKDMTFRDYAQGAYRMRGIGRGQTIQLVVIPEVANKIAEDLNAIGGARSGALELDVAAWLLVNSMRAESLQFIQLCLQELHTVWRKHGLAALRADSAANTARDVDGRLTRFLACDDDGEEASVSKAYLRGAIDKFREPVEFAVDDSVPVAQRFEEVLDELVAGNADLTQPGDEEVLAAIRTKAAQVSSVTLAEVQSGRSALDSEVVNENEQEAEQEQQKEKDVEKQKEREIAYSRDDESQNPWLVELLGRSPDEHGAGEVAFYPFSAFRVHEDHAPLAFPSNMLLSDNFFRPSWVGLGERRLKNVTVLVEWVPDLERAPDERYMTLHRVLHRMLVSSAESDALYAPLARTGLSLVTLDGLVLNRTLNLRQQAESARGVAVGCSDVTASVQHVAMVCLKWINNAMFYSDAELETLAEGLVRADESERLAFFETLLRYRRRERMFWADTPVAKVFTRREEWGMLKARALVVELTSAMQRKRMYLRVAFRKFDADADGYITQDEVMRAFSYLKLGFSSADAIQLFHILDLGTNISLSFDEFVTKFAKLTLADVLAAESEAIERFRAAQTRASDPSRIRWRCAGCSAMSPGDRIQCLECGRSHEMQASALQNYWVCGHCTYSNSMSKNFCDMCDYGHVEDSP
ncbi:uncharacterized protein AMSG_00592 [Thecamonas trahens ATCC 50062]|uniref:ubiquitinyl hydrolase 1 n=1 Tax=Thecamonas trahens ATCC 50062 TaxID=461836 RepID=A0A0L0D9P8_THETB|nr:hypothetical protein AMSG_00592 [Thecamonas trahens ATCC 50062]KNC48811.1 hypothetical protein AMSG_00592 [Thecamonas trahens ATCC 50062]|eukprot:XP_013762862.1 hypothetical protein AMSG_00592 [Thecamonas trahens ATCC 50062]